MVPTLRQLAISTLIRYRQCLSDIGEVPPELLADVLACCSPAELAEIEDATLLGSGRCLAPWLWPHWQQLFIAAFGEPTGALPPLPAAAEGAAVGAGAPADFRCCGCAQLHSSWHPAVPLRSADTRSTNTIWLLPPLAGLQSTV